MGIRLFFFCMVLLWCISSIILRVEDAFAKHSLIWKKLQNGLEFTTVKIQEQNKDVLLVRVIPKYFDFRLLSAKVGKHKPLPITEWQTKTGFALAINASMFGDDTLTSIGYFKTKLGFNNTMISSNFGAMFCAIPYNPRMLNATLIDMSTFSQTRLKNFLLQYKEAVQNYRLIDGKGTVVWQSYSTTPTTISAVGVDAQSRLLFIHSQALLTPTMLATLLVSLPIDIRTTMYTEGGKEAILSINVPKMQKTWFGVSRNPFSQKNNVPIPNIIALFSRT